MKRGTWGAVVPALALAGVLGGCGGSDDDSSPVAVTSLSSPENLTSGGDSLLRITSTITDALPAVVVTLNGSDVSTSFQKAADGRTSTGLVTGMKLGENTVEVREAGATGRRLASLTLTNHPLQGPVLYAPQEGSFHCQTHQFTVYPGGPRLSEAPSTDPNCVVPTRIDWVYHDRTRAGTAVWQKYDPAAPPPSVETTTLQDGRQVPYIVRVETGVINRGIYQIAMLANPATDTAPSPLKAPSYWNGKLVYPFGQSCGSGWYVQGTAMGPVGGSANSSNGASGDNNALNDLPLGKGFAVANSTLNYFGQNCNHIISAETMMMVKERVVEGYGPVRYTMGWGNSGSAMQQSMIADAYPGLLDGSVTLNGFPDNTNPASVDSRLLYNYQLNHTKGGTTENGTYTPVPNTAYSPVYDNATAARRAADPTLPLWSNGEIAAASGFSTYHSVRQQASFWAGRTDSVLRPANAGDRDNVTGGAGNSSVFNAIIGAQEKYSPPNAVTSAPLGQLPAPPVSTLAPNPTGLRPNVADHNRNTLGVDANGFGRSYTANVGVQYGLNALNSGQITMAQFIHLNQRIGGFDIDGNLTAARVQPDATGLRNAYRSGMIMWGGAGLSQTAILNMDGLNNEATGAGDLHLKFFHFMVRARLIAAAGHADNHVMWNGQANVAAFTQDPHAHPASPVQAPRPASSGRTVIVAQKAFDAMDQWLTAVSNDRSNLSRAQKVVRNKPTTLVDGCYGATTPGAADDFIAERQLFGGYNSVFRRGNGSNSPAGTLDIGATPTRCNAKYPASSYPRFEAGEPLQGRTMQCTLKAVSAADYAGYAALDPTWTGSRRDGDLAAIAAAFPGGVCDYSKPGLEEQPLAGTWIQVTGLGQMRALHPLER
ncbi:DUF6351 family protein [Piscinibacter koreensis]|uniref:DUF6351 domain-containing protein n=1 Tax=Piscinibacter koreensis TaxID=2742824 RepID=A0A7Y6NR81_9BURK|nr:DUF6351 family protein [Schlegelella koreensis]NUZ07829.1 hypothetical protein [Schlegelella koreensis]